MPVEQLGWMVKSGPAMWETTAVRIAHNGQYGLHVTKNMTLRK